MKAAVFHGVEDIRIQEWPQPHCGPKEVLVKVSYCAICGTDLRIFYHGHKKVNPPAIIGHEITGVIEKVGESVSQSDFRAGDPVTVVTSVGCGHCRLCQRGWYNLCPDTRAIGYFWPGGFAEYLLVPEEAVAQQAIIRLPEKLSLLDGTLVEPLSCVINGQSYLNIRDGETVVIFGGGPVGLMHACLAKAEGASQVLVVDPDFERLERFGKKFEGLILLDPKKVKVKEEVARLTAGAGADVVITACPVKQAQLDGLEILAGRGRISFFGGLPKDDSLITLDANLIHYRELSVFGAFASNRKDYLKAAQLLVSGVIPAEKFITRVFSLEEIVEGLHQIKQGAVLKAVVKIDSVKKGIKEE
ncbi:MAG TPA: zinc-dependent dehydrogenase [bacterium]|nr:zinc-dependent dehydrogenase [bacterium]HPP12614.1 zinc-dependent dehydrogenase [bacterium]